MVSPTNGASDSSEVSCVNFGECEITEGQAGAILRIIRDTFFARLTDPIEVIYEWHVRLRFPIEEVNILPNYGE